MPMKHFRNMNFSFFPILILMLLTPAVSYTQVIPDSLEIKVNAIFQEYNTLKSPGCAIAIISNGKAIMEKGFGMANMEHDIPISPLTVFDIASVSKQFTGFAISSLIQEGKISDSDDIRKYLPFVPDFGKTITISHLLHHTSGLRDWPEALGVAGWRPDDVWSFDDILRMVQHQKELDFEPGTSYSYSNTGYNLLAAIVEKVSGKSFAQWIHDNIFSNLKMEASLIPENHTKIIRNRADSYVWTENKFIRCSDLLSAYGSSSIFTSLKDMISWSIHFDEQLKQKNPVYIRMQETGRLENGDTVYYGFGLGLSREGEPKRIAHTGGWSGFRSTIVYYPDKHLSIIILSNSGNLIPRLFAEKIADVMLQRGAEPKVPALEIKEVQDVKVKKGLADKYVGTYQLGTDWYITITMENDQLMSRSNGESPYPITAKSDSTYWVDAYNNAITFVRDSTGYMLRYKAIMAKRIVPFTPDSVLLKQFAGKYYSEELSTEYILTVRDGKLWMYHIRLGVIEMFPEPARDTFGCAMGTFRFIKNEKSGITGFDLTRSRVRNIHFIKQ
jgi:CubicO group peptidase (beta-lactamase class C family)